MGDLQLMQQYAVSCIDLLIEVGVKCYKVPRSLRPLQRTGPAHPSVLALCTFLPMRKWVYREMVCMV